MSKIRPCLDGTAESQIFAAQQNEQKSAKWQSQYNKMRQIRGEN